MYLCGIIGIMVKTSLYRHINIIDHMSAGAKGMKFIRTTLPRFVLIILVLVLEVFLITELKNSFKDLFLFIEGIARILAVFLVISLINNSRHLSFDILWILLIMVSPVFGTLLYIFMGTSMITSKTTIRLVKSELNSKQYYRQDPKVLKKAVKKNQSLKGMLNYFPGSAEYPIYVNRKFNYYPSGEKGFPVMLDELSKAKKFIFIEYFIIEEGKMWDSILDILKEKASAGLDVRVMYDDMGSIHTLPAKYAKQLEGSGIKCQRFNKINPVLGPIMNHRDHRKIMVIDGKTAFSGGVNLADEYINEKEKFGYWKDNIIRIKGEAVWSYTVMFLTNWNALRPTDDDYEVFHTENTIDRSDGFIAPYGETPLDDMHPGQDIYMNILNSANDYVYIFTPYLIIDTELSNSLILAASRGVDVRIITPGIPDKKLVWQITRSYYKRLIKGNVKIYEYTPGFDHAKVFVADDRMAAVGTLNLDYRSLYLHFENGTFLCGSSAIADIRDDLLESMKVSHQMKENEVHYNIFRSMFIGFVKLFASQM